MILFLSSDIKILLQKNYWFKWPKNLPICSESNGNFIGVVKKLFVTPVDGIVCTVKSGDVLDINTREAHIPRVY